MPTTSPFEAGSFHAAYTAGAKYKKSGEADKDLRKYHMYFTEMWLEIVGLVVLIGVMFGVGFHLF